MPAEPDYSYMPVVENVRRYVHKALPPLVDAIDKGALYPSDVMPGLGENGAFVGHINPLSCDLNQTIDAMSEVAQVCGGTGFMTWCQAVLVWYIANSDNAALKSTLLTKVADA